MKDTPASAVIDKSACRTAATAASGHSLSATNLKLPLSRPALLLLSGAGPVGGDRHERVLQSQNTVNDDLFSKQLLRFCFARSALQSKKAVTAYLLSKQLLPFCFARRH